MNKLNSEEYYSKVKQNRENFIMSLWNWSRELEKFNDGKKIYDTLSYPGEKPLVFHLQDMRDLLKSTPERSVDKLDSHNVVQVIQYFSNNCEERMYALRESGQREALTGSDEHENQVYWELSTSHKKQYFERLLATIQTRKTHYYEAAHTDNVVICNENIYTALEKLASVSDDEKNAVLDSLLLALPNQAWDYMPDVEDIFMDTKIVV